MKEIFRLVSQRKGNGCQHVLYSGTFLILRYDEGVLTTNKGLPSDVADIVIKEVGDYVKLNETKLAKKRDLESVAIDLSFKD